MIISKQYLLCSRQIALLWFCLNHTNKYKLLNLFEILDWLNRWHKSLQESSIFSIEQHSLEDGGFCKFYFISGFIVFEDWVYSSVYFFIIDDPSFFDIVF
jgi:hypothetical protein